MHRVSGQPVLEGIMLSVFIQGRFAIKSQARYVICSNLNELLLQVGVKLVRIFSGGWLVSGEMGQSWLWSGGGAHGRHEGERSCVADTKVGE